MDPLLAPPPAFAMRSLSSSVWRNYKLPDVPVRHFAEQLTRMDVVSLTPNLNCTFTNFLKPEPINFTNFIASTFLHLHKIGNQPTALTNS